MFWAVYHRDPDDCTECEFHALLGKIPGKVREEWGYGGDPLIAEAERADRAATIEAVVFGGG